MPLSFKSSAITFFHLVSLWASKLYFKNSKLLSRYRLYQPVVAHADKVSLIFLTAPVIFHTLLCTSSFLTFHIPPVLMGHKIFVSIFSLSFRFIYSVRFVCILAVYWLTIRLSGSMSEERYNVHRRENHENPSISCCSNKYWIIFTLIFSMTDF